VAASNAYARRAHTEASVCASVFVVHAKLPSLKLPTARVKLEQEVRRISLRLKLLTVFVLVVVIVAAEVHQCTMSIWCPSNLIILSE